MFLRIFPFLLALPVFGIWLFIVASYDPLYFCVISCSVSFYIYTFVDLGFLFSLVTLAKGFSILFIFSKNQVLVNLSCCFTAISFIYTIIFVISLVLLSWGLVCSFCSSLRHRVRLFICNCSWPWICILELLFVGFLGGSVDWVSNLSSGRDLTAGDFKLCIGLCANTSGPGACLGFCVSLSLCFCFKNK